MKLHYHVWTLLKKVSLVLEASHSGFLASSHSPHCNPSHALPMVFFFLLVSVTRIFIVLAALRQLPLLI